MADDPDVPRVPPLPDSPPLGAIPPSANDPRRLRVAAVILVVGVLVAGAVLVLPRLMGGDTPGASPSPSAPPGIAAASGEPSPGAGESVAPGSEGPASAEPGATERTPRPTHSGPPRVRALADPEIYGFLPYWMLDTATPDLDRLTTIAYFGVEAGAKGELIRGGTGGTPPGWAGWTSDTVTQLIADAHAKDVRVVLTIQRFSWTSRAARKTKALLDDPAARAALATDIVSEVTGRGADGVNLDFEPMSADLSDEFTDFVYELRAQMDAVDPGLQLTFDFTSGLGAYQLAPLTDEDAADAGILMGYDYRVGTAQTVGSISPLDSPDGHSLRTSTEASLAQMSPDHLILGLPWYGRAWDATGPGADALVVHGRKHRTSIAYSYANAIAAAQEQGRLYDPVGQSAYTVIADTPCPKCAPSWWQVWYDDVDAFTAKVDYAKQNSLRGIAIWALGHEGDRPELWTVLDLAYGGMTDSAPPTGQLDLDPAGVSGQHGSLPQVAGQAALTLSADDGADGSGLAFVRVSNAKDMEGDQLATGTTYPATDTIRWSLADPVTGGSRRPGQRTLYVQWRDVAGNWSEPVSLKLWDTGGGPETPGGSPEPSTSPPIEPSPGTSGSPGASPSASPSLPPAP